LYNSSFEPEAAALFCMSPHTLEYVSQLRSHSLVVTTESTQGMRIRLLESLREFAAEQLSDEERRELGRRHLNYFVTCAEAAEPNLVGPEQAEWMRRLTDEHDNLRAALSSAHDRGNVEAGARICAAVWRFWWIRGHAEEGLLRLQPVIDAGRNLLDSELLGRTLHAAGTLAWANNRMSEAEAFHREALAVRRNVEDLDGIARSLGSLGNVLRERGDYTSAYDCYLESLELFRKLGDRRLIATSLLNLGTIADEMEGDNPSYAFYSESLAIYRELGDKQSMAIAQYNLANILWHRSEYAAAEDLLRACMEIRCQLDSRIQICFLLTHMARVFLLTGRAEAGVELLAAAWTHLNSLGAGIFPSFQSGHMQAIEIAQTVLDGDTFARAYSAGERLSLSQAIDLFYAPVTPDTSR